MKRLKIAVPASLYHDPNYLRYVGYPRLITNDDFPRSLLKAGASCYLLPQSEDLSALEEQVQEMDAFILSGGDDISPLYTQAEPRYTGEMNPARDRFEFQLLQYIEQYKKPVLGVCRGLQLINVFYGGTLYQDLNKEKEGCLKHLQDNSIRHPWHRIDLVEGSHLYRAMGQKEIWVNSLHHQAVKDPAPGFTITARASDGTIEALEKDDGLCIGVQWHPEMLSLHDDKAQAIFNYFVEAIRSL